MIKRFFLFSLFLSIALHPASADLDLLELYKTLHQNPELSYQEHQTSKKMSNILKELGFDVTTGVGGTGFVAQLKNGAGPTLLIRTDLDGLPIKETTGLSYASTATQVNSSGQEVATMHACGHDIHMTVFAGTAKRLIASKDRWNGTLVMIGQPAEEVGGGARDMLKDGLFERFPRPDYNLALHVSSDLPVGSVGLVPGFAMANVDSVDIVVKGQGGHGAYPQKTIDPIVIAADIISTLQTIVSRELSPLDPAVVTVGSINGGTKHNIIPNSVKLQLTVRSYTEEARATLLAAIKRISHGIAAAHRVPESELPLVTVQNESIPALYNNPQTVKQLQEVFTKLLGEKNVFELKPEMIGEDFSRYGQVAPKIPSVMYRLGTVSKIKYRASLEGELKLPSLHSSNFAPEAEATITTGVSTMVEAALSLLSNKPS